MTTIRYLLLPTDTIQRVEALCSIKSIGPSNADLVYYHWMLYFNEQISAEVTVRNGSVPYVEAVLYEGDLAVKRLVRKDKQFTMDIEFEDYVIKIRQSHAMVHGYYELSKEDQNKAMQYQLNEILKMGCEGISLNRVFGVEYLDNRIYAAGDKAEAMKTPWFMHEYVMEACGNELKNIAYHEAVSSIYYDSSILTVDMIDISDLKRFK